MANQSEIWADGFQNGRSIDGRTTRRREPKPYRVALAVKWQVLYRQKAIADGVGTTQEISSTYINFLSLEPFPTRSGKIRVRIEWPAKLEDGTQLNLIADGSICASDGKSVLVAVSDYEFRTRPRSESAPAELP